MELTLKTLKNAKSLVIVLLLIAAVPLSAQNTYKQSLRILDTVFVAPPTGERETDRASILSALKEVMSGGTIQFAPGIYLIGEAITITNPQITIVGHPEGSIIRGCDSAKFGDKAFAVDGCNGFNLTAGNQSVHRLRFENTWHALILGGQPCKAGECPPGTLPVRLRKGGYLIEDNTFRDSQNGIRVVGQWKDPAVIRNNNFINTYHAVVINGMTAHVMNNNISVPEPHKIPNTYHPGLAIMIGGWDEKGAPLCDKNIIAGNKINGHPDAIAIVVFEGGNCRQNVIRDNRIEMSEVRLDSISVAIYNRNIADSTVSGIPIALLNDIGFGKGLIENNLIENNHIFGAEGLAIEITGASNNQIVNNIISEVTSRNPFPGSTLYPKAPEWSTANGSGIWISPGSNGNEIINSNFEDIASAAVFIEGENNRVKLNNRGDIVRDFGFGNKIGNLELVSDTTIAFTHVTIIEVEKGLPKNDMTVILDGERITAVGPANAIKIPVDATVIDATGKYIIPGLWDMHAHTGSDKDTREIMYPLLIAHGVTGIRNMHGDCIECGEGFSIEQVKARSRAIASGDLLGPRVVASSSFAGSHKQAANRATEGSSPLAPATEEDARAFVRLAKERGADFIKVYDMLPREAYFALADEAKKLELPFAGHVPIAVRASEASDAGQRSIEHLGMGNFLEECSSREKELRRRVIEELNKAEMGSRTSSDGPALLPLMREMVNTYNADKCMDLANRFVQNETWIVPTLMVNRLPKELGEGWREDPYVRFLSSEERQIFEDLEEAYVNDLGDATQRAPISQKIREVLNLMNRAGVKILAGTDAGDVGVFWGTSLHQELELLVDAGLSEAEALRAATLGPAEFFQNTDDLGTIEKGKVADLVLLNENPLEDISNIQKIEGVVLNGRYFDRQALDEMLLEAEKAANPEEHSKRKSTNKID